MKKILPLVSYTGSAGLLKSNIDMKKKGEKPKQPLRQFFRVDPKVSRID